MPKAFVFTEYGGPELEALVEVPTPSPGPGQLLVSVRAAGVNPVDWKKREGHLRQFQPLELPAVLGQEVAGVVAALGEGAEGFEIGDEVFGPAAGGGYAENALVPAELAAKKPPAVSFNDAATLTVTAATAHDALEQLELHAGDTLLVLGVAGGVGVAAAQIARSRGVAVVGTASPAKAAVVSSLGASPVAYGAGVADRVRAAVPGGIDAILDTVGGESLRDVGSLVGESTKLVTISDPATATELGGAMVRRAPSRRVLVALGALVENGVLDPMVTQTFPLDQAAQALAAVETGHATGKVVLEIA
jgi:NADPH:quinone reductase-like Zn-dependent oxidoreductase